MPCGLSLQGLTAPGRVRPILPARVFLGEVPTASWLGAWSFHLSAP